MLHALRRLGFRWQPPDYVFMALVRERGLGPSKCSIPPLAWLAEAGCPVYWPAALAAAEENYTLCPGVKAWLQERSAALTRPRARVSGKGQASRRTSSTTWPSRVVPCVLPARRGCRLAEVVWPSHHHCRGGDSGWQLCGRRWQLCAPLFKL